MEKLNKKEKIEKKIDEAEQKLKSQYQIKYTNKQIFFRDIKENLKNWKVISYGKLYDIIYDMIKLYLPISQAKLIDDVSSLKNLNVMFSSF